MPREDPVSQIRSELASQSVGRKLMAVSQPPALHFIPPPSGGSLINHRFHKSLLPHPWREPRSALRAFQILLGLLRLCQARRGLDKGTALQPSKKPLTFFPAFLLGALGSVDSSA